MVRIAYKQGAQPVNRRTLHTFLLKMLAKMTRPKMYMYSSCIQIGWDLPTAEPSECVVHFGHPRVPPFIGEKRIVASIDRIGELSVLQRLY